MKCGITVSYEAVRQWWLKGQGSAPWQLVTDKLRSYEVAHGVILKFFRFSRHRMRSENYRWLQARAFKDWNAATAAWANCTEPGSLRDSGSIELTVPG